MASEAAGGKKKGILGGWLSGGAKSRAPVQRSEHDIQHWLVAKLAEELKLPVQEIDIRKPFASYGLDSRTAVGIVGDMERWLGQRLVPTLVWDFPNIEELARHVASGAEAPAAPAKPT
jgi:acyl carrier protein